MVHPQSFEEIMKEIEDAFAISFSDITAMIANFHDEMRRGLSGKTSSLKMLPTYIDLPTGNEKGRFLALDLGGTNFRILLVRLAGDGKTQIEQVSSFVIPRAKTKGKGSELFDFIAQAILQFLEDHKVGSGKIISLGFTFSFPVDQTEVDKGKLVSWTKGFSATGVVGKDVVGLLAAALKRKNILNVNITALANDTVGTLLAKAYETKSCDAGVIFGTGTNGCYREAGSALGKLPIPKRMTDHMIVNTEWGNYNLLPENRYDRELDKNSKNPTQQQLEKMISGMYLGELTRLVVKDLIRRKVILESHGARFVEGVLTTSDMAAFEDDYSEEQLKVAEYLESKSIHDSTPQDRYIINQICRVVSRRAARVSAAAISSLVTWMDPDLTNNHTVAVDGALFTQYPHFKRNILKTLNRLHGDKSERIQLASVSDGSGVGAAIAASVVTQRQ